MTRRNAIHRRLLPTLALTLLALAAMAASGLFAPLAAQAAAPGTPGSVTVTRADGTLTASWDAVDGATSYHVTYSSDGKHSWSLAAFDHPASGGNTESITITGADNAKTYVVGVRAKNAHGGGGWRNSASAGPYTPPTSPVPSPTPTPAPTATPTPVAPPGTPSSVSVTRTDETLNVSWPAVTGATGYHVTYSIASAGDRSWVLAAYDHPTNSIAIKHVLNATSYIVGVRGLNSAGGGGWRNSAPTGGFLPPGGPKPLPDMPASVTLARGDGTLTVSWPAANNATSYSVFLKDDSDDTWKEGALFIEETSRTFDASNYLAYTANVRSHNGSGDSLSRDSSQSAATATLLPPSYVAVTRGDGTLSASWAPADGATSYHVGWSDNNGASWHRERDSYVGTTIDFTVPTVDNNKSYGVNVMSTIGDVQSVWRYSEFAPPYVPQPTQAPAQAPASVTVTRSNGKLAASWPAVEDATMYHVTYSSDGKQSWSLAAYDHAGTSIEITGADNAKSYVVGVRGRNSVGGGPWRNSASAGPYTPAPPAAPANLGVAPGDGFLGIEWDAVDGADSYEVRAKTSGASNWHDVATGVTGARYDYVTTLTIDHVGVRARNADGASAWSEVSRLPSSELLNTVSGEVSGMGGLQMAAAMSGGAESEVMAQSNQVSGQSRLNAPVWGTIDRSVNRQRGEIDLNWTHSGWATGFNLVCSDTDGWTWNVCGWEDNSDRVQYTSVPTAQARPVTVTHYRRGSDSRHTPGDYQLIRSRHYTVAIRAVNAQPDQASDWVSTQIIRPIFPAVRDFTWTRTGSQITLSWTPNPWTTGYNVYCDNYTPGGTYNPSYELCATLTDQDHNDSTHSVTITKSGGTHNWSSLDDTSTLDIAIDSSNATGSGRWLTPLIAPPARTMTASNVGVTTVRLTVGNHSGQWWYKANAAPHNTCQGPVAAGTVTKDLTGLSAGTTYTYSMYGATGCADADKLATAASFTTGVSVSNLSETEASASLNLGSDWGQEFTTGSAANGYKLQSVTLDFSIVNPSGNITVSLREQQSNNHPATTALATLTGTPAQGQVTFTCSGAGCNLNASTTYFVFVDGNEVVTNLRSTASDNETPQPSGNGWSIENAVRYQGGGWALHPQGVSMKMKIEALARPILTATNVSSTGATLNLANNNTGAWHYKANTGPHTTCQGPVSTRSVALTGFTVGTSYTYTAYSDSACSTTLAPTAAFTTPLSAPTGLSAARTYSANANSDSIALSWTAPASSTGRTGYAAECSTDSGANWSSCGGTIASTATSHTISGLHKGNAYVVRLRATGAGSAASAWVQSSSFAALSTPGTPTGLSMNTGNWTASWTAPSNTGNGGGTVKYAVECKRSINTSSAGESTTTSKYVGGNSHCTQWSNHGNYFRVRAWNIVWGSWSGWHKHA